MKGTFWSFVVFVEGDEVPLPKHGQILEPGRNTFNAKVEDIDVFLASLEKANVRVVQKFCLDDPLDTRGNTDAPTRLLAGSSICLETKESSSSDPEEASSVAPASSPGGAFPGVEDESEAD